MTNDNDEIIISMGENPSNVAAGKDIAMNSQTAKAGNDSVINQIINVMSDTNRRDEHYRIAMEWENNPNKPRMRQLDLSAQDLSEICLSKADLSGTNLENANLTKTDLRGAILKGTRMFGAQGLDKALLGRAIYDDTTTWPIEFNYKRSGAFGPGAILEKAGLANAQLRELDLRDSILVGADLSGIDFWHTDLSGADLTGATLNKTDFRWVMYSNNTKWPEGFTPPDTAIKV